MRSRLGRSMVPVSRTNPDTGPGRASISVFCVTQQQAGISGSFPPATGRPSLSIQPRSRRRERQQRWLFHGNYGGDYAPTRCAIWMRRWGEVTSEGGGAQSRPAETATPSSQKGPRTCCVVQARSPCHKMFTAVGKTIAACRIGN